MSGLIDPYTLYPSGGGGGPTYGNAFSVDLASGTTVGTTASIGVEPYDNWQQLLGFPDFGPTTMEDDTGSTADGCQIQLSNGAGNNDALQAETGDLANMFDRAVGFNSNASFKTTIDFTSIPFSKYDVILYFDEIATTSSQLADISDGTTTKYLVSSGATRFTGSLVESDGTSGSPDTTGNYMRWSGLTASTVTLTINPTDSPIQFGACGVQLIERTD